MDDRKNALVTDEEIRAAIMRRKVRTWGGIAVGSVALVWGLIEGSIPHLAVAAVAFGIVEPGEVVGLFKRGAS